LECRAGRRFPSLNALRATPLDVPGISRLSLARLFAAAPVGAAKTYFPTNYGRAASNLRTPSISLTNALRASYDNSCWAAPASQPLDRRERKFRVAPALPQESLSYRKTVLPSIEYRE
jgi:hypothetical protein